MSEEATGGTPTAGHVSIAENGAFILSPEALAAMDNVEPPAEEEATPAESEARPAEQPQAVTPPARKIKHNGQEVEVAPEQEIELLQKGYNYEQKMAALESERARLQSYNGLVSAIEASPEIRAKVSQALGYETQTAQPQQPQFDDPIEQLKWEIKQETRRELEEQYFKPMQQQTAATAHQTQLNGVKQQVQADPQYKEIQAAILDQIKALPESVGKDLYARLDQDPRAYTDMFNTVKARLTAITPPPKAPQPEGAPKPTKTVTRAPILEGGNLPAAATTESQKQAEHIKALEKRSKAGDFRATGELMAMLA